MRSRARRKNNQTAQNLDSFLDVLTNTVGVLMFISLFVTLIATGGSTKGKINIQTPLSSSTNKESLWFEIKNEKVSYLDLRAVREQELELSGNLPNCNKPLSSPNAPDYVQLQEDYQSCLLSTLGRQNNFRTTTQDYNVSTVDDGVSLVFAPKSSGVGETIAQLDAPDSNFQQVLAKYNTQKDYLIFVVRPDSFEAFRAARKKAWEAGYEVGWEPQFQNVPIKIRTILGSELPGGQYIGVQ
jgi:hypothetical protein